MIVKAEDYLQHYGTPRHSGRYPWGSGGAETTRHRDFLDSVEMMRKNGLSDTEIARGMGITTSEFRRQRTVAVNLHKQDQINQVNRLTEKGLSNVAIGKQMGINESTVRSLKASGRQEKLDILHATSNMLQREVDKKGYIDVGRAVERDLALSDNPAARIGISKEKFTTAVAMLQEQGYKLYYPKVRQLDTGHETTLKVLGKPGSSFPKIDQIRFIQEFSEDGGRSYLGIKPPLNISSRRIDVKYAEDGGGKADGVIYIRPGVKDISIGKSHYAQVRVAVDGTHYLKGMAMYKDDLPKGVDLQFNTSKSSTGRKKDAFKELKDDPDNPFGATIRQIVDDKGNVTSAMNIVGSKPGSGEEGGWEGWSRTISSQILSKQSPALAKSQLNMTAENRLSEFHEIMSLTNPTVKRKLLQEFADSTDSAAVHLQAAALPGGQAYHVILPISKIKPNEVYAPNYRDGEKVVLIRSPHAGTFEIPQLTVNNRNPEARKLLGTATRDAVGIHHTVAERLSGADFDGDTVIVVPNRKGRITHTPTLDGLKGFDPRSSFPPYDGMRTIDGGTYNAKLRKPEYKTGRPNNHMQNEMGKISNLITDMTIRGANTEELARAVRHSMVIIDAEKHHLDYKSSAEQNNIKQLQDRYQKVPGRKTPGASTLISRAGSRIDLPERKPRPAREGGPIDPVTGKKVFVETGRTYVDRSGKTIVRKETHKKLAVTEDARTLLSPDGGTTMERIYADHSNKLKGLANQARKESLAVKSVPYSPSAKAAYSNEVASLDAKLNLALKNAPLERQAQVIANTVVSQKRQANPNMDAADRKKIENQALTEARNRTGASKHRIKPTQAEWNAIQAGAISNDKLEQILTHGHTETIRALAMPKTAKLMTPAKKQRATAMLASGYTQAEVAEALGVSVTTLKTGISE